MQVICGPYKEHPSTPFGREAPPPNPEKLLHEPEQPLPGRPITIWNLCKPHQLPGVTNRSVKGTEIALRPIDVDSCKRPLRPSSMRRAIIHIGMPRTGSTTFQHILARLRPELNQTGILYPDLTPRSMRHEPHINHQHFGETLDGRRSRHERQELLQALSAILSRCNSEIVVLSYEDFIQQQPRFRTPAVLHRIFAKYGFATEALVVVKPQSEHLNSIYAHRAQLLRERQDFRCFARAYEHSARFNYDTIVHPWIAAFAGRIRAVPIRDQRSTEPLVLRLLTELGLAERVIPMLGADDIHRVENRSPGPLAVEVSRRLRGMYAPVQPRVRPREVMRFVEHMALEQGFDQDGFRGVGPDLWAHMEARYCGVNDRFASAVWGRCWAEIVTSSRPGEVNEFANRIIDSTTEGAIENILRQATRQFDLVPRTALDRTLDRMVDHSKVLQRRLHLSRWRVI